MVSGHLNLIAFGLALSGLTLVGAAAAAQTDVKVVKREQVGSWTYVCFAADASASDTEPQLCRINSQLWTKGDQHKLIFAVVVQPAGPERVPVMLLRLPPIAKADQKPRMQVDDKPALIAPPLKCAGTECRSEMSMSQTQIGQMKAGSVFHVTFAGAKEKDFRVDVSLNGFTRAFDTLMSGGS